MKYLLIVVPMALAACSSGPLNRDATLFYKANAEGAGFGPYSLAEYHARQDDGQGGMVRIQEPWTYADAVRQAR